MSLSQVSRRPLAVGLVTLCLLVAISPVFAQTEPGAAPQAIDLRRYLPADTMMTRRSSERDAALVRRFGWAAEVRLRFQRGTALCRIEEISTEETDPEETARETHPGDQK